MRAFLATSLFVNALLLGATSAEARLSLQPAAAVGSSGRGAGGPYRLDATVAEPAAARVALGGPYRLGSGLCWAFTDDSIFRDECESGALARWTSSQGMGKLASSEDSEVIILDDATATWRQDQISSGIGPAHRRNPLASTPICMEDESRSSAHHLHRGFECGDLAGLVPLDALGGRLAVGPWAALGGTRLGLELDVEPGEPAVGVAVMLPAPTASLALRLHFDASRLAAPSTPAGVLLARLLDAQGTAIGEALLAQDEHGWHPSFRDAGGRVVPAARIAVSSSSAGDSTLELRWTSASQVAAVEIGSLRPNRQFAGTLLIDEIEVDTAP